MYIDFKHDIKIILTAKLNYFKLYKLFISIYCEF